MSFKLIHMIAVFTGIFPVVVFAATRGQRMHRSLGILFLYVCLSLAAELCKLCIPSRTLCSAIHNVFTIVEFVLIVTLFYLEERVPKPKNLYVLLCVVFGLFYLAGFVADSRFYSNNVVGRTAEAFVLCFLSVRYYFDYLDRLDTQDTKHYFVWFNVGFMIYFSGIIFDFLYSNLVLNPSFRGNSLVIWTLQNVLIVVFNVLLTIGIYKWRRSPLIIH